MHSLFWHVCQPLLPAIEDHHRWLTPTCKLQSEIATAKVTYVALLGMVLVDASASGDASTESVAVAVPYGVAPLVVAGPMARPLGAAL